ncbi:MAG: hypothetical protein WBC44_13975 [Planctomycetaceae bacterium]
MSRKFLGLMLVGGVAVAAGLAATTDDANAGHRHGGRGSCGYAACGHGGFEYDDDDACGWSGCGYGGYSGCGYSSCGHYGHGAPGYVIRRTTTTIRRYYAPACAASSYGYSGYSSCNRPAYQGYYGGY